MNFPSLPSLPSLTNMRTIVRVHLARERIDVLLAALAPLVIMLESGYANAWAFAGGHLGFDFPSLMAFGRGIFMEALVYVCFKLVRMFVDQGRLLVIALPLLVGLIGMIVSAGCNLSWLLHSPEMQAALAFASQLMPGWMAAIFRLGLGLIFPVAVGLFALFDVRHLIEEALKSAHLDNRAVHVHRAELHRTAYLRSLKKASKAVRDQYDTIAETDAQNMVMKVKGGDLSFGAEDITKAVAQSSVKRLPAPAVPASLPAPRPQPQPQSRPQPQPQPAYPVPPRPMPQPQARP